MTSGAARRLPWPEIAIEGVALGLFMVSACVFGTLLEHPASPLRASIPDATLRRGVMGLIMGLTAVGLIYSPWGRRSGAHMNPAVTLSFLRLGRLPGRVAAAYVAAQFAGGAVGVGLSALAIRMWLSDPAIHWVATIPGAAGTGIAFAAEFAISFLLFGTVLMFARTPRLERFAGLAAGTLVALWILIEAPLSGMSMNPARTFGSALFARDWTAFWVYVVAPPAAMLGAAWIVSRLPDAATVSGRCAKLDHPADRPCIFCATREGGEPGARDAH